MNELLFLGILVSLIYTEFTGLSPGGIIAPAYFALYLSDSSRMIYTILLAFLTWGVVTGLSHFMILYGRRQFAIYIMVGMLLRLFFSFLYKEDIFTLINLSHSIGYLIPGLVARDLDKQDVVSTILSLGIVTLFIWIVQIFLMR